MRGSFIVVALIGYCLNGLGQCPITALITESENPENGAWFSEFNKSTRKLYVSGEFRENLFQVGSFQLNSLNLPPDNTNSYLLQVNEQAEVDWLKHMGKKYDSTLRGRLASTHDGVISAFGFNDTAFVDGFEFVTESEHILLSKFDLNGDLDWVHQVKSDFVQLASIVTDEFGSVYALGSFVNWVSIQDDTLHVIGDPTELSTEVFMAKFKSDGALVWLQYVGGGENYNIAESLSYSDGKLYGCGRFREEMQIGTEQFVSSSSKNGFLFAMDTMSTIIWSRQFMSDNAHPLAIAAKPNKISVIGLFESPMTVNGHGLNGNSGSGDGFLVTFDSAGSVLMSKAIGGNATEVLDHIEFVSDSLILVSGYSTSPSFDIDGLEFQNAADQPGWYNQNHFSIVLDASLKAECLYYTESTNSSLGLETNFNHISGDTVWVVSGFSTELPIGDTSLYSVGGTTFIAKTCMGCDDLLLLDTAEFENLSIQLAVHPNPATTFTTLTLPKANTYTIVVMDAMGKVVYQDLPATTSYQLTTTNWPHGIYAITATNKEGVRYTSKLVVGR